LACGYCRELLVVSNYLSLLLIPAVSVLFLFQGPSAAGIVWQTAHIDWLLILALLSYNSGGMRPALAVEAAAHLSAKRWKAVYLVVLAKILEGVVTLGMAHLVLVAGTQGPLALSGVAAQTLGPGGRHLFDLILLCTFANTMAPAMMVNARQVASLTGLNFWPALAVASLAVYFTAHAGLSAILTFMSGTGLMMVAFVIGTAYFLHKHSGNKS
jgi:hypothetical protein